MATVKLTVDQKRYIQLVADYCALTGEEDMETILSGGEFVAEGSDFRLTHIPESNSGIVCLWCDFGEIPEGMETECYEELLQANAENFDGMSPMMALCPDSNLVVCSARLLLEHITAEALDDFIGFLAEKASAWRERIWKLAPALENA